MSTAAQTSTGMKLGQAWWMVGALFVLYVVAWLDRLAVSMLVAPIKERLLLSDFEMSLILGPSFALSYAIFGIPLGWAADHYSRRLVIFCGVFIWAAASLACGFATSFAGLMACRVVVGIGEAGPWLCAEGPLPLFSLFMWKSADLSWFALPNAPTERAPFNEGTTSHEQC